MYYYCVTWVNPKHLDCDISVQSLAHWHCTDLVWISVAQHEVGGLDVCVNVLVFVDVLQNIQLYTKRHQGSTRRQLLIDGKVTTMTLRDLSMLTPQEKPSGPSTSTHADTCRRIVLLLDM